MIVREAGLSVSRQCALLGIARSSFYYRPRPEICGGTRASEAARPDFHRPSSLRQPPAPGGAMTVLGGKFLSNTPAHLRYLVPDRSVHSLVKMRIQAGGQEPEFLLRRQINRNPSSAELRRARLAGSGAGNSWLRISPPGLLTVWMLK
jgi:hypothetical protein